MVILKSARRCIFCIAAGIAIAGCSQTGRPGPQYVPSVPLFSRVSYDSAGYRTLYSFGNGSDGSRPQAALLEVKGTFYGTTPGGGGSNIGIVFSMTESGKERVLHSFRDTGGDGWAPIASLIDVSGTLYGTTDYGGAGTGDGYGTVFSVTTSGKEKVLYSFAGGSDGANPQAGLLDVKGTLYGTTSSGGAQNLGTVFRITTGGKEKVLHSFGSGSDGASPEAGLIDVKGTLYGTTFAGGTNRDGTVFSITTGGKEKVLHSFTASGIDGSGPAAGLVAVNDTLYGTTAGGGSVSLGLGTVFSVTTGGKEKLLHSFGNGSDGYVPEAALLYVKADGMLYGTTEEGGAYGKGGGTLFAVTPAGKEKVAHSFGGTGDGIGPFAAVIAVKTKLYGTTFAGGKYDLGTAFAFTY